MIWFLLALSVALLAGDVLTTRRFIALRGKEGGGLFGPGPVTRADGSVRYTRVVVARLACTAVMLGLALYYRQGGYLFGGPWVPGWIFLLPVVIIHALPVISNLDYISDLKARAERDARRQG